MSKCLVRQLYEISRTQEIEIYPLGDLHVGSSTCQEKPLIKFVNWAADQENLYILLMGDYCDFITRKDPRFSVGALADWIFQPKALNDIAKAQRDRFLDIIKPVASKVLCVVAGNHETAINRHYERDVYGEIVTAITEMGGHKDRDLALEYNGFLWLDTYHSKEGERKGGTSPIVFALHHGYVGGKLKGAKALEMQRFLWYNHCDIAVLGHSHNTDAFTETVVVPTRSGKVKKRTKFGAYSGTFDTGMGDGHSSYGEVKGYPPLPLGGSRITLRPQTKGHIRGRIEVAIFER